MLKKRSGGDSKYVDGGVEFNIFTDGTKEAGRVTSSRSMLQSSAIPGCHLNRNNIGALPSGSIPSELSRVH